VAALLPCLASGLVLPAAHGGVRCAATPRSVAPSLLFSKAPPPPAMDDAEEGSFGKALRRVQGSPARAAMALTYAAALYYVGSGMAPAGSPEDTLKIVTDCLDTAAPPSLFFVVFNALGVVPALYAAVLLPGAREKNNGPVPVATIATSFFAGFGGLAPYLILRRPRTEPVARSELGFVCRTVTESRAFGAAMLLASLALASRLFAIDDLPAAFATYGTLFDSFGIVNVSSFDLLVLSAFFFEPCREDMQRRGWWTPKGEAPSAAQVARLAAFCAVPVLGPAAYVATRPRLPAERGA